MCAPSFLCERSFHNSGGWGSRPPNPRIDAYVSNVQWHLLSAMHESCRCLPRLSRGLGGLVVIDAAIGAHGKSRPRFKPGTLLHRCSDLGQVVNLSLSVA